MIDHSFLLQWLESEGFYLWFDEKTLEWTLCLEGDFELEEQYSLTGGDKLKLIEQAFHHLAH